jgi:hypothetical protein
MVVVRAIFLIGRYDYRYVRGMAIKCVPVISVHDTDYRGDNGDKAQHEPYQPLKDNPRNLFEGFCGVRHFIPRQQTVPLGPEFFKLIWQEAERQCGLWVRE